MGYLLPTEYVQYGLTAETSDDWITLASSIMEGFCRRPSLLVTSYTERMRVRPGAQSVRVSYLPLTSSDGVSSPLTMVRTRFGRPRRGESVEPFQEQIAATFGIVGSWTTLNAADVDVNAATGELTLPWNLLGLNYNEVEATYTAGVVAATPAMKVACAQIVRNAQATPALNVKGSRMDTLQMQYFSSSLLDEQVQTLLRPYLAQRVG